MPDNTAEAINARIDQLVEQGREDRVSPELLVLIDNVYRPFCHCMAAMEAEGINIDQARKATAYLLANILDEMASATTHPQHVKSVRRGMLRFIGDILSKQTPTHVKGLH